MRSKIFKPLSGPGILIAFMLGIAVGGQKERVQERVINANTMATIFRSEIDSFSPEAQRHLLPIVEHQRNQLESDRKWLFTHPRQSVDHALRGLRECEKRLRQHVVEQVEREGLGMVGAKPGPSS